ncbi:hypothetical protein [Nocardia sp. NPDC050710]|uniref:hypothetical protein n=1 Tax=Nocardia sp. NPDC050710 TaxID=3157220 RepID=UPI0033D1DEC8
MSSMFSWVAVRGRAPEAVLDDLGLTDTGIALSAGSSRLAGEALPDGWYVVVDYDVDPDGYVSDTQTLEQLSREAEVVACYKSSYGPDSAAAQWKSGRQVWIVTHSCDSGAVPDHIEFEGELPEVFADILADAHAEYADSGGTECLYEVAVDLAAEITGFREDDIRDLTELTWAD